MNRMGFNIKRVWLVHRDLKMVPMQTPLENSTVGVKKLPGSFLSKLGNNKYIC